MKQKRCIKTSVTNQSANRQYKDRLFKAIFGRNTKQSKQWRLDLYNALNNTDYTNPDDLTVTTIENVIYITMKNDISFLIGSQMNLYEQQSSFNPNMPLRGLMYFAQLYQMYISERGKDLFSCKLVKIPTPCFIVFYNGDREISDENLDECKQHLSDAFEGGKIDGFEWTARVINISGTHSLGLQKKCKALYDYCSYVNRIKQNINANIPKDKAIADALDYAINNNLLDGYFKKQKMEVLNMSLTEFDQELYDRNRRQEGFEDGERSGLEKTARKMLERKYPINDIVEITGLPIENIQTLADNMAVMA